MQFMYLTVCPALTGPLRTDEGCQILMKLGQDGQYITQRHPELKKTRFDPRGGFLGYLIFSHRGKSTADLSHD